MDKLPSFQFKKTGVSENSKYRIIKKWLFNLKNTSTHFKKKNNNKSSKF
jgi:hypothetical protein